MPDAILLEKGGSEEVNGVYTKMDVCQNGFPKVCHEFYFIPFCFFFFLFTFPTSFLVLAKYILNKPDKECQISFDEQSRKWLVSMTDRNEIDSTIILYFFQSKFFFLNKLKKGQPEK